MKGSLKGSQLDISTKAVKRALEIAHANAPHSTGFLTWFSASA